MVNPDPQGYVSRLWGGTEQLALDSGTKWRLRIFGIDPLFNGSVSDYPTLSIVEAYGSLVKYNNTDTDSNHRIANSGIKLTDYYCKSEDYEIGGSTSSEIEFDFINDDGYLASFNWNWTYFFYAECWDPTNSKWISIPLGAYWFEKPTKLSDVIVHVKAHDAMQRIESCSAAGLFNGLNFSDDPYNTVTLNDVYNAFISLVNIGLINQQVEYQGIFSGMSVPFDALDIHKHENIDYPFFKAPFDPSKYNCRQVLEFIAGLVGGNAYVGRDYKVYIRNFTDAKYTIGGTTHYYTIDTTSGPTELIELSKCEFQTPQIDNLKVAYPEENTIRQAGTGSNTMFISNNPLFKAYDASTVVSNLYTKVSSLQAYTPMSMRCIICPTIEAGDVIRLVYGGTTYSVPIFQQTMTWQMGPFVSEIVCSGRDFRETDQGELGEYYAEVEAAETQANINDLDTRLTAVESAYLPKTGGTVSGDLTVGGVLDVTQRRADATLSSAGWYNIIKYNIGSSISVKFATAQILNIRMGTQYYQSNNSVHEVTMLATYGTSPRFANELSRSNVNVIDKIRYRYGSNNVGWIDVHYAASASNDVWMMFDVGAYNTTQAYWISQNFVPVDDAPATGGTADVILSEHAFIATSGEKVIFTPTNGSSYSNYGGCWYSKSGDIVEVHVGVSGLTANTLTTVFTLPEGYRPKSIKCAMGQAGTVNNLSEMQIGTGGLVRVQSTSAYAMADITFICSI